MKDYSKLGLFDFLKLFFVDNEEWNLIPDNVKESYAFMLIQYLSIKEPEMMNLLNKSYSVLIVNLLHEMFKHHGRSPGWMYTKVQYRKKQKSIDLTKYPKELVQMFISLNELNSKDIEMLLEQRPTELKKYLDEQTKGFELKTK